MTPRPEAEIQTSWAALSAEEQATVRADCMAVGGDTAANTSGSMNTGIGQTNSSPFGTATTGSGLDQVTQDTWTELCSVLSDL